MRYLVKSRDVTVQPFRDTPVTGGRFNFKVSALFEAKALNWSNKDYSIQWYVLDTQTGKVYV